LQIHSSYRSPVLQRSQRTSNIPLFAQNSLTPIKEATDASFTRDVIEASKKTPVLALFYASWCPPCKAFMGRAEQLAKDLQGQAQFARILVSDHKWYGSIFPVHTQHFKEAGGVSYPSIMIYANGKPQAVFKYYDRDSAGQPIRTRLIPGQIMGSPSSLSDEEIRTLLKNAQRSMKP
jgi:thioredoxin-like negative regulator of GroEL